MVFSFPFKGKAGMGMGLLFVQMVKRRASVKSFMDSR
jgi:hypothetical protein